jgi:hypothetical protein
LWTLTLGTKLTDRVKRGRPAQEGFLDWLSRPDPARPGGPPGGRRVLDRAANRRVVGLAR